MSMPNEQDRPANGPGVEGTAEAGAVDLQAALAAAEARALESRDLYMRALAEMENIRKRAARDVEQAHKYAVDRFANDLIGVKDSLELGLLAAGDAQTLRAGTEATLKQLTNAFEKNGLTEIDPLGQQFDPQQHEAMAMQPSAEHVPDSVTQVVQKGYALNGRLLRPARVIVAKAP
ncbi:nucleotide exchange factor GrpE [Steroidobacter sp. S1-65]|uniref:Protein GrpE n=2 Tax=Steroidobacter gossypii TaxID=2805490 RepID=A0ABS1WW77_9GAMM|nr:nucleotide exchange factor GrpE [Steroidobacter gossypii]MBM0105213.1 nucleotide exchange factor GrpE [Steroidobacter gossypii]